MKPSRLLHVLDALLTQRWPAFVWGPPGVGKSSIVHQLAKDRGLPVIDIRASLLDPTDLRGIPAIENGQAVWCPPSFLPTAKDRPGVLFLDEINAAPPLVQASLYQLVLDRKVGEYELPQGWWIVAAGNRQQDRAVTFRMSSALANRFVHLELEVDVEDWRSWALKSKLHPLIVSFIALRPSLLMEEPGDTAAYATPRSWQMASDVLNVMGSAKDMADVMPGIVGQGAAVEFAAYARKAMNQAQIQRILDDPTGVELPKALDGVYMLTSWLAFHAEDPRVAQASAQLLNRLPPEFSVVLARDMIKAQPSFMREEGYKTFLKTHGQLIAQ